VWVAYLEDAPDLLHGNHLSSCCWLRLLQRPVALRLLHQWRLALQLALVRWQELLLVPPVHMPHCQRLVQQAVSQQALPLRLGQASVLLRSRQLLSEQPHLLVYCTARLRWLSRLTGSLLGLLQAMRRANCRAYQPEGLQVPQPCMVKVQRLVFRQVQQLVLALWPCWLRCKAYLRQTLLPRAHWWAGLIYLVQPIVQPQVLEQSTPPVHCRVFRLVPQQAMVFSDCWARSWVLQPPPPPRLGYCSAELVWQALPRVRQQAQAPQQRLERCTVLRMEMQRVFLASLRNLLHGLYRLVRPQALAHSLYLGCYRVPREESLVLLQFHWAMLIWRVRLLGNPLVFQVSRGWARSMVLCKALPGWLRTFRLLQPLLYSVSPQARLQVSHG